MAAVRRLPPLPSTRDVLRMYNIQAKKKLSQNFILDPRTLDKIARTADPSGKYCVEVGPGPGGITRALIGNGAREVHVIEKDPRFLASLQLLQEASAGLLHINIGDCLNYNMSKLFPDSVRRPWEEYELPNLLFVGNLPFNVATPLIVRMLRAISRRENLFEFGRARMLLTFQHEVAARMIAPPGSEERCRLSVMCQNWTEVRYKYTLPGGAFVPAPDVDVGVVTFLPLRKPYIQLPFEFVERVTTAVFHGKRKKIANSCRNLFPPGLRQHDRSKQLLEIASIPEDRMAIGLTMDEMEKICFTYKDMCEKEPALNKFVNSDFKPLLLAQQMQKDAISEEETD